MKGLFGILMMVVTVAIVACARISDRFALTEGELAKVGSSALYMSDIESLFTAGLSTEDSIKLVESYIDMWVRKQLKIKEAERFFHGNIDEIDRMLEDYRNSLLIVRLEQHNFDKKLDTVITLVQIRDYYEAHVRDYTLTSPSFRGTLVSIPKRDRLKENVKDLIKSSSAEKIEDLKGLCAKNDFAFHSYRSWSDLSELNGVLPYNGPRGYEDEIVQSGLKEFSDNNNDYILYVEELLKIGEPMPVTMPQVEESVKRIILNQRKQELMRNYEDSLYAVAFKDRSIIINK